MLHALQWCVWVLAAAAAAQDNSPFNYGLGPAQQWFRQAGFGMFMHW